MCSKYPYGTYMELIDLLLCPACQGPLTADPNALLCPACDRSFEVIHGIPDFRPDPPDQPRIGDICREVIDRWETDTYQQLSNVYHRREPDALDAFWHEHERLAPQRGERRWDEIRRAAQAAGQPLDTEGVALDLGCGIGSALFALAPRAQLAVGLDILLTDLLLAKKRLLEAGHHNVAFVCASGTELPIRNDRMAVINATDVIEHMPDQQRFLDEARRVMAPGACFFLNSPNRFSVLTPEPHVRLWGMGWLPRKWMEPYVQWRLGKPYRGKRLLSIFELRRFLHHTFGHDFAVWPFVPRSGAAHAIFRAAARVATPILPQHNVLAWKPTV